MAGISFSGMGTLRYRIPRALSTGAWPHGGVYLLSRRYRASGGRCALAEKERLRRDAVCHVRFVPMSDRCCGAVCAHVRWLCRVTE